MKKNKIVTSIILSLTVFTLTSCAQIINEKNDFKVPTPTSTQDDNSNNDNDLKNGKTLSFNDGWSSDFSLNENIVNYWSFIDFSTQVLELTISGIPSDDIDLLRLNAWSSSGQIASDIIAKNLKKNVPFSVTSQTTLRLNLSSSQEYRFNLERKNWDASTNRNDLLIDECKISFEIKDVGFMLIPNEWNNSEHHIYLSDIASEWNEYGDCINIHMSFDSPADIYNYTLKFVYTAHDNWIYYDEYSIKHIKKGHNEINLSCRTNLVNTHNKNDYLLETRFYLNENWYDRTNPKSSICFSNFHIDVSLTDTPRYTNWIMYHDEISSLHIMDNNAFIGNSIGVIHSHGTTYYDKYLNSNNFIINNLVIFDGVTYIPTEAFANKIHLSSVELPSSLEVIEYKAFGKDMITSGEGLSVSIPASVTYIDREAFTGAKFVELGWTSSDTTKRTIKDNAFNNVQILQFSDGTRYLNNSLYYKISGAGGEILEIFGTGKIEDFAFDGFSDQKFNKQSFENITSIIIHEGITAIGNSSFSNCYNVTSISLPETLETIENCAFFQNNCTSIIIPKNVTYIGSEPFSPNFSYPQITLAWNHNDSTLRTILDSTFRDNPSVSFLDNYRLWYYNCAIYENGTTLNVYANGVINDTAFTQFSSQFPSIDTIVIEEGVTEINSFAFQFCHTVTSILLPQTLSSINNSAFYGNGFSSVTIPSSVTFIGENAFTPSTNDSLEVILNWPSTDTTRRNINSSAFLEGDYKPKSVKYNDGVNWNP